MTAWKAKYVPRQPLHSGGPPVPNNGRASIVDRKGNRLVASELPAGRMATLGLP